MIKATAKIPMLRHFDKNGLKKRKSVLLTEIEIANLNNYVNRFRTPTEAAEHAGIGRVVLYKLMKTGSTSEETFMKIKKVLKKYSHDND